MPNHVIRPATEVMFANQPKTCPAPPDTLMKPKRAKREQNVMAT